MKGCRAYRVWFRDDAACAAAIREVIYQSHRVVCRLSAEAVEIIQVCHGAKLLRQE